MPYDDHCLELVVRPGVFIYCYITARVRASALANNSGLKSQRGLRLPFIYLFIYFYFYFIFFCMSTCPLWFMNTSCFKILTVEFGLGDRKSGLHKSEADTLSESH